MPNDMREKGNKSELTTQAEHEIEKNTSIRILSVVVVGKKHDFLFIWNQLRYLWCATRMLHDLSHEM